MQHSWGMRQKALQMLANHTESWLALRRRELGKLKQTEGAAPGRAHRTHSSMRVATWRSTMTALSGYAPTADSPESISASARWRTTSEMSATCRARHKACERRTLGMRLCRDNICYSFQRPKATGRLLRRA